MSQHVKSYPVKSNAARAAKKFGLTRADLFEVNGGWTFNEPAGPVGAPTATAGTAEPASESPTTAAQSVSKPASHPDFYPPSMGGDITDPSHPDYDARALHTLEPTQQGNGGNAKNTQESDVKTKSKAKTAKKVKTAKPAKAAKAAGKPGRKRAENGIGAKVIAELKARWTPAEKLFEMTNWAGPTLRGYISLQGRKPGFKAERRRVEGKTEYRIVKAD